MHPVSARWPRSPTPSAGPAAWPRCSRARTCSSACPARGSWTRPAWPRMNPDPIVFAMANPDPEVSPEEAARLCADRRHRALRLPEPDQQRPLLPRASSAARSTCRATQITEEMKTAAAEAIAAIVADRRAARGLHHPLGVQPRRGPGGGRRRRRAGPGERDRGWPGPRSGSPQTRGVRRGAGAVGLGRRSRASKPAPPRRRAAIPRPSMRTRAGRAAAARSPDRRASAAGRSSGRRSRRTPCARTARTPRPRPRSATGTGGTGPWPDARGSSSARIRSFQMARHVPRYALCTSGSSRS